MMGSKRWMLLGAGIGILAYWLFKTQVQGYQVNLLTKAGPGPL